MKTVVTGANGFIGRNLTVALQRAAGCSLVALDRETSPTAWSEELAGADIIYHLAGVNRPKDPAEFVTDNVGLTETLCDFLLKSENAPSLVLASSTQATLDNPYGESKRRAERIVIDYAKASGTDVYVYRLPGVFGKWCRPNYNSVVATFCHNIARGMPITLSDSEKEIELVYVDDVVQSFIGIAEGQLPVMQGCYADIDQVFRVKLGPLADRIKSFRDGRVDLLIPDMGERWIRRLYATYLSYLPTDDFAYALTQRCDERGELAELFKSTSIGQIFVSRTRPGITRGHHYHDSKVEKFIVVEGEAIIRFRPVGGVDIIKYPVSGREFRVVDIPPGYTHSIENVGVNDLIVLFWANEIFDPGHPDTFGLAV